MASQYGKYTRPDGDEAILLADPLTRAAFERKGFTYVGPADTTPGLEPANPGRDGEGGSTLDAEAVVREAFDVVSRKLTGTWTLSEAAEESAETRSKMAESGAFPTALLDAPGTSAVPDAPLPAPVTPVPGGSVSMTGSGDGVPTDASVQAGAADLSAVSTAPAGSNFSNTTSSAGTPGTFAGTSPTLKGELDQTTADPSTAWTEGQYVRVNSRDYYWDGGAWVMGRAPATVTTP